MSDYQLTWISGQIAVGRAPMSYADLDAIRRQGVDAIVNLCGEYCDLHELEAGRGFEVYYLPIPDECAPDLAALEKGLAWLDEAVYLGKKVLIHCRFGIGRTGTFLTAYLIRRGMGLKGASRRLKKVRSQPSSWRQWRHLKKYSKQSGILQSREPALENRHPLDLSSCLGEYENLVQRVDPAERVGERFPACGRERDTCCFDHFQVSLVEAVYLSSAFNRTLSREVREAVILRAVAVIRQSTCSLPGPVPGKPAHAPGDTRPRGLACPLNQGGRCLVFAHRPLRCRLDGVPDPQIPPGALRDKLHDLSGRIFRAFSKAVFDPRIQNFSVAEAVSGRFVQICFDYLAGLPQGRQGSLHQKPFQDGHLLS